jgi:hypothetical protein
MVIEDSLELIKYLEDTYKVKFYKIKKCDRYHAKITRWDVTEENLRKVEEIYHLLKENGLGTIVRTESGAYKQRQFLNWYSFDFMAKHFVRLECVIRYDGVFRIMRLGLGKADKEDVPLSGRQAFQILKEELASDCVDLESYALENKEAGLAAKEEIEHPLIESLVPDRETFGHVYHVDFHSAYPGAMLETYPEFTKTFTRIYNNRKSGEDKDRLLKLALDASIGFMQSEYCSYKYAHLSKAAINTNNKKMRALSEFIESQGGDIIAYNTDGIWYQREAGPVHGEGEGKTLGTWENDHFDCTWRCKGCNYEYLEVNQETGELVYTPVVRGFTNLDKIKPREEWKWGEWLEEPVLTFKWNEEKETFEINKQ